LNDNSGHDDSIRGTHSMDVTHDTLNVHGMCTMTILTQ